MYDSDTSAVTAALQQSGTAVFTSETINRILALTSGGGDSKVTFGTGVPDSSGNVTVAAGTEVVFVASSDTQSTVIKPPANAPVVIFQGKGGVVATLNDGVVTPGSQSHVDRVVVGSAGNDRIVVADAKNTQITLGTGNSTVTTGGGVDTVAAGLGNSSIVGGNGDYAVVKLAGSASNYQVTVNNGHAVVTDQTTHKTTDISKIQYVQLDNGNALVFAKDSVEAQVATLYHTAFGRDAEAGGLNYWFDLARGGATTKQIADAFTQSTEFASKAALSDSDFVNSLYQNTFSRAGEATGIAYWQDQLAHGTSRADLINTFSQIAAQNIAHTASNAEAHVTGNVTIVQNIV